MTAGDLVIGAGERHDVVRGDFAGLGDDEAPRALGVAGGELERAGVGLEASARGLSVERLVRLLVVAVVEEVAPVQLQYAAVVIDVGRAGQAAQHLGLGC